MNELRRVCNFSCTGALMGFFFQSHASLSLNEDIQWLTAKQPPLNQARLSLNHCEFAFHFTAYFNSLDDQPFWGPLCWITKVIPPPDPVKTNPSFNLPLPSPSCVFACLFLPDFSLP